MILLLLATADRTLRKGIKAFKKESNLLKVGREGRGGSVHRGGHGLIRKAAM